MAVRMPRRAPLVGVALVLLMTAGASIARSRSEERIEAAGDDSTLAGGRHLAGIPVVFSTPETGFGAGAGVLLTARGSDPSPLARPSTYSLVAIFTEKNQASAEIRADVWFTPRPW